MTNVFTPLTTEVIMPQPQHVSDIVKFTVARNKQLSNTLDKLLALYRKETGLVALDNPITLEAERLLSGVRRRG